MSFAWIAGAVGAALALLAGMFGLSRKVGSTTEKVKHEKAQRKINDEIIERFEKALPTSKGRRRAARLELQRRLRDKGEL